MATLKTVIRIEVPGADSGIGKMRELSRATEDFTKKLKNADFSFNGRRNANDKNRFDYAISEAEQKLKSANFSVEPKATDGLKKITEQIGLTKIQALTLTYTLNDVAASLASGASPFTILLQQGGQVTQAFGGIRGTFSALAPIVLRLAPAIAAVGAAVAAVSFLKMGSDAAKAAVELRNLADRANVSFSAFQKLAGVASIKGIAKEDVSGGLERLSQALGKASKSYRDLGEAAASDETVKFFDKLGADFRGFTGTSAQVERAVSQLARGLSRLSGADRFDALQQLRSLVGPDFAQFIARSGRSIDQLAKQYGVAANQLTAADLALAEQQTAAATAFGDAWTASSTKVGALFLPATLAATRFLETIRDSAGTFSPLNSALASTSDALRDFFLIASGDQGAARRSPVIAALVDGLTAVKNVAGVAGGAIKDAFDAILIVSGVVADAINDTFGTEFTAGGAAASAAIALVIGQITGLNNIIIALAGSFARLALAAALNPYVIGFAVVAGLLLTIAANIGSIKAAFARLGQDFDVNVVQRVKVWGKLLEAGWKAAKFDGAGYKKGVDEAIALENQRQEAIKRLAAERLEQDKRDAAENRTILGNNVAFVKQLWADSGAQSFMDGVVSQIGKATQSLGGLSGQAKATVSDIRNAGNAAAGAASDALQGSFQKVAPGRWKAVFDAAQPEIEQFAKDGAGRWKAVFDAAKQETSEFVRGADGFWRQVTDGAEQAAAASGRAADAIRRAKGEQTAAPTPAGAAPAETGIEKTQKIANDLLKTQVSPIDETNITRANAGLDEIRRKQQEILANQVSPVSPATSLAAATPQAQQQPQIQPIETARAAIEGLRQLIAQALQEAQNFAAGSVILVANGVTALTNPARDSINTLISALDTAIQRVTTLAQSLTNLPKLPNYSSPSGNFSDTNRASGGMITGPGTGTSDSVPIWASTGEFIVRAAAVRKYGVDFLRRINGMALGGRVNLAMPRFAMGGLVQGPAYAGAQQSGRPVTLVLDGKSFGPFSAGGDVVGAVEKHVSMRKLSRTTARVPSRIG